MVTEKESREEAHKALLKEGAEPLPGKGFGTYLQVLKKDGLYIKEPFGWTYITRSILDPKTRRIIKSFV